MVTVLSDLEIPLLQCESDAKLDFLGRLDQASRNTGLGQKDRDAIAQFVTTKTSDHKRSSEGLFDYSALLQEMHIQATREYIWAGKLASQCEGLLNKCRESNDRQHEKLLKQQFPQEQVEKISLGPKKNRLSQEDWAATVHDLVDEICQSGVSPHQQVELVRKLTSRAHEVGCRAAKVVRHQCLRGLAHIANAARPHDSELNELLLSTVRALLPLNTTSDFESPWASVENAQSQFDTAGYPDVISALYVTYVKQFQLIPSNLLRSNYAQALWHYLNSLNEKFSFLSRADAREIFTALRDLIPQVPDTQLFAVKSAWDRLQRQCVSAGFLDGL